MFKAVSTNAQSRARGAVLNSTANSQGLDPSVFKQVTPSGVLTEQSRAAEAEVSLLYEKYEEALARLRPIKLRISEAMANRANSGAEVPRDVWSNWQAERIAVGYEVEDAKTKWLRARKKFEDLAVKERMESFESVFLYMAKTMLSEPVYDRIVTAAIHRMSDKAEGPTSA